MPTLSNPIERKVIPRWNQINSSISLGIGEPIKEADNIQNINIEYWEIEKKEYNWKIFPSIITALELLGAASSSNTITSYKSVLQYLNNHRKELSKPAVSLLERANFQLTKIPNNLVAAQIEENLSEKHIYRKIHELKTRVNDFQNNPIVWNNISHLYGQLGQFNKAERAMSVALILAPRNRIILRAAAKMYHQFKEQKEKALWILRKSELIDYDPWIIAADIALSDAIGLKQRFKQKGMKILKYQHISDFHLSELRSAIGTNLIYAGDIRRGRKLLNNSLHSANENSIAQIQWIKENFFHDDIKDIKPESIIGSFEARAKSAFSKKEWKSVISNSLNWLYFHPFSENAAMLAGYMLFIETEDVDNAIEVTRIGQRANPNCLALVNNRIYFETQKGSIEKAESLLDKISEGSNTIEKGLYHANRGMISIRKGNIDIGREEYRKAVKIFSDDGYSIEAQSAMLHWAMEENLCGIDPNYASELATKALKFSDSLDDLPMVKVKQQLIKVIDKKRGLRFKISMLFKKNR